MIRSKKDYLDYLEADRKALSKKRTKPRLFGDEIWKYERLLRKLEYYRNCKRSLLHRSYALFLHWRFHALSIRNGFTIPCNVFGPGLSIAHIGTIVVHSGVRVGANCRIHVCVNIGAKAGKAEETPVIGNDVYIGPGAKIFGGIQITDGIAIGANSVVNMSFLEPNISIAGVPARKISNAGSRAILSIEKAD